MWLSMKKSNERNSPLVKCESQIGLSYQLLAGCLLRFYRCGFNLNKCASFWPPDLIYGVGSAAQFLLVVLVFH